MTSWRPQAQGEAKAPSQAQRPSVWQSFASPAPPAGGHEEER